MNHDSGQIEYNRAGRTRRKRGGSEIGFGHLVKSLYARCRAGAQVKTSLTLLKNVLRSGSCPGFG